MKRGVVYLRVSLDATGEGRSVARQREACEAVASLRGVHVVEQVSDNSISAYGDKKRPGWERVLKMIEREEIDYLIAWHIDRMTRSMLELERLILLCEEHGVAIITATGDIDLSTDVGRMVARILGAVARAEVERKAERQRLANAQRAAAGEPNIAGPRPFGYEPDGRTIREAEAKLIRDGAEAFLNGASLASIARKWNELKDGRKWGHGTVGNVFRSPRYIGQRVYNGEIVGQGNWPAILDLTTFLEIQNKLASNKAYWSYPGKGGAKPKTLLSVIARCGVCGGSIRGYSADAQGRRRYRCDRFDVTGFRDEADAMVTDAITSLLADPDWLAHLIPEDDTEDVRPEIDAARRRLEVLGESFVAGTIGEDQFKSLSRKLRDQIDALEEKATGGGDVLRPLNGSIGTEAVRERWKALSLERQRAIIEHFLDVKLFAPGRGHRWTAEANMKIRRRGAQT